MLNFTQYKMSAARNRSEKAKPSPQHKRNRSIEKETEDYNQNMKAEYPVSKKYQF